MKAYTSENIRNVIVLGHGGSGKTTVVEALAFATGAISRMKKIDEGGTISDYDLEEIRRKNSINLSIIPIEWEGIKINLIDTPGFFDFVGEVYQGLSVADGAIIVISCKHNIEVGTIKSFELCMKYNIPIMVFVTDMDDPNGDYIGTIRGLNELYGKKIAPFHLPIYEKGEFSAFVNVVKMEGRRFIENGFYEDCPIPEEITDELAGCRQMIIESVAETSDEFMDRYFNGEEFSQEEISMALRNNVGDGTIVPVLIGCARDLRGVRMLLLAIDKYFSPPKSLSDNPLSLYVFKTIVDPFIGKYSLVKIESGTLTSGMDLYNPITDMEEKIAKIYVFIGNKPVEVNELHQGDIGALSKLSGTQTGHTLCKRSNPITYPVFDSPIPYEYMAYETKNKGDEDKVSAALHKIMNEDLTIREVNDKINGQLLLYGMGEQQLEVVVSKLLNRYKVEIELVKPKIAYKETIRKKVESQGKYKKQSGGHGQYGDVKMEFEPLYNLEKDYVFEEKVFGGAIPKNYFPAIEKGIAESCLKGVLGGYPVVGVKATLLDGSYHSVDSSEMAFKMAAMTAFKNGIVNAGPVLLEPIVQLTIVVPEIFTGDIMGDLNKKRGKVSGMNSVENNKQEIIAEIPMASVIGYSTMLRSITGGAGEYAYEFIRYQQMPEEIQDKLLSKMKEKSE